MLIPTVPHTYYRISLGQIKKADLPRVSIGGPRGSIMMGPLGSPIMLRWSAMGGPLMSRGGPLISGGPPAIWDICTGAWCCGGAPM